MGHFLPVGGAESYIVLEKADLFLSELFQCLVNVSKDKHLLVLTMASQTGSSL